MKCARMSFMSVLFFGIIDRVECPWTNECIVLCYLKRITYLLRHYSVLKLLCGSFGIKLWVFRIKVTFVKVSIMDYSWAGRHNSISFFRRRQRIDSAKFFLLIIWNVYVLVGFGGILLTLKYCICLSALPRLETRTKESNIFASEFPLEWKVSSSVAKATILLP